MAPNKVQKRSTNASNKDKAGALTRDGRVTSTNPIQSLHAKTAPIDERAASRAEKAFRKAQRDKNNRLEKHEAIDVSQYPSNSFVALSISSDKLRSLNHPAAEKIWGVDYKPLGLSKDWTTSNQPASQIKYQPIQAEHTILREQTSSELLYATASSVQDSENLIINNNVHSVSSQTANAKIQKNQSLAAGHSGGSSQLISPRKVKATIAASPSKKGKIVTTSLKRVASKGEAFGKSTPQQSADIIKQNLASPAGKEVCNIKSKVTDNHDLTKDMAPVKDPNSVPGALKDVVQNLFEVQTQVHGFVNETQPLLVDKVAELAHNLNHLQTVTSPIKSPDNPIHQTRIAPEIIDYVDDGRNPDIFTRDFVELVSRGNAVINGKQQAFRDFSQIFAEALKKGFPGLTDDVDRIMKDAEAKNKAVDEMAKEEAEAKKEVQENGAGQS